MKSIILFALSIFIFTNSWAQKTLGVEIQLNMNYNNMDKLKTDNNQCVSYANKNPGAGLLARLDLSENFGLKVGLNNSSTSFQTTLSTISGPKSVKWGTSNPNVPLGFYIKKPNVIGRVYGILDFQLMLITKKNITYNNENDKEADIYYESHQKRDWGCRIDFAPGIGYTFSKRSRIEFSLIFNTRFYGQTDITNNFEIINTQGKYEIVTDKLSKKDEPAEFNFDNYFAIKYVFMFKKRDKPATVPVSSQQNLETNTNK